MSAPRVLLLGYYGKGNFGDDVLLTVTYHVVKQALPRARISVVVDNDGGGYVERMLGDVELLPPGRHGHFDLIVHGGGGVYFDFKEYTGFTCTLENIVRAIGFRAFITLENIARRITGKARTSAQHRLGFGIGVGTYTQGSPRLRASLPIMADYDALWVRDADSIENLKEFAPVVKAQIIQGSDLAFLTQHWMANVPKRVAATKPRLGIILRDWAEELGGTPEATLREILAQLAAEYDITGFIFDRHTDPNMQYLFGVYKTVVWQPRTMRIADFAGQLAQQDVLLTSRLHGAICGACLGVPSVIVTIEPKLAQAAAMLPNSTRVVTTYDTESWPEALRKARVISPDAIAADIERNRLSSQVALDAMNEWLA